MQGRKRGNAIEGRLARKEFVRCLYSHTVFAAALIIQNELKAFKNAALRHNFALWEMISPFENNKNCC